MKLLVDHELSIPEIQFYKLDFLMLWFIKKESRYFTVDPVILLVDSACLES